MDKAFEIAVYKDDTDLFDIVEQMQLEHYRTGLIRNKEELHRRIKSGEMQLLLFDENMNDENWSLGIKTLSKIRRYSNIPIIVVSSVKQDYVKIIALNSGADDFVERDCNSLELSARITGQLRRYHQLRSTKRVYRVGALALDAERRIVSVNEREVSLTPTEYEIIKLLMENKGQAFSNEEIYERIWHMSAIQPENIIAVHMNHIRGKIEPDPKNPIYLKVIWGVGYKME